MRKLSLTLRVLIGLVAGVVVGLLVNRMAPGTVRDLWLIDGLFNFLGQIFLRLVMMLVPPLVFISITCGVAGMDDIGKLGRVGGRSLAYYGVTSLFSCGIGLALALIFKPGRGLDLSSLMAKTGVVDSGISAPVSRGFWGTLLELVPKNPFAALGEGNMLQIIVFALFLGVGIALLGEKTRRLRGALDELNALFLHLIAIVMEIAPFGIFGFMAKTLATLGIAALLPLARYVGLFYLAMIIWGVVVGCGLLLLHGMSPAIYFKKFFKVMVLAFSTSSSNATLPMNLAVTTEQLGASNRIASFTLPLGATVNMNGTAAMQGLAALFIAQLYGVDLTVSQMVTIALTATLAAVGTAGVPGAGPIMLSMVLTGVGLPLDGVALIFAVDRLVDMARTTANITGDSLCTLFICKAEGEFDRQVFESKEGELY